MNTRSPLQRDDPAIVRICALKRLYAHIHKSSIRTFRSNGRFSSFRIFSTSSFRSSFPKHVLADAGAPLRMCLCHVAVLSRQIDSRATLVNNGWTLSGDVFLMPAALPEELHDGACRWHPARRRRGLKIGSSTCRLTSGHTKNHRRLFEAFRDAQKLLPPKTGLVLTGSPDGFQDVIKGFEDLPIIHLGFVPHEQVAALFREAVALVYFSLFEGFGMPLLEAFNHGMPVLCSNATSLPEVGGDAVLACDPTDVGAMTQLMSRIVNEEGLRESLFGEGGRASGGLQLGDACSQPARRT